MEKVTVSVDTKSATSSFNTVAAGDEISPLLQSSNSLIKNAKGVSGVNKFFRRFCLVLLVVSLVFIGCFMIYTGKDSTRLHNLIIGSVGGSSDFEENSLDNSQEIDGDSSDYDEDLPPPGGLGGDGCFAYDSIVTRLVSDFDTIGNPDLEVTEKVLLSDINLEDYILSGLNHEFSKVIHRTHYTKYDGFDRFADMRKICFEDIFGNNAIDNNNDNCIEMTDDHLIYVNGIDLDNLIRSEYIKIGDYLYNEFYGIYVKVVSIDKNYINSNKYYRNIITESGNIIINNGFYVSSVPGNNKYSHIGLVYATNTIYYFFTNILMFDNKYFNLVKNEYVERLIRIPLTNFFMQLFGLAPLLDYNYPLIDTLIVQSFCMIIGYYFIKAINKLK